MIRCTFSGMLCKQASGRSAKDIGTMPFRAGVGLLLGLYLTVFLFPPGYIPHVHNDRDIHTGDVCQKDACHIAIYHPGDHNACHHKFHFSKALDECPLCHSIAARYLPLGLVIQSDIAFVQLPSFSFCPAGESYNPTIAHADRGPPVSTAI